MPIRFHTVLRRAGLICVLIGLWQASGSMGWSDTTIIPSPDQVLSAIVEMTFNGQLILDAAASLRRVFGGFFLAMLAGGIIGGFLAWFGHDADWLSAPLELLRPIPPISWIPLAILWFGIGEKPAYFIVFLGAFFPIFTNVFAGVRTTDKLYINAARCLGANHRLILTDVILPSALPSILTGLRVGFGVGWICVITAELVGAQSGLGYMIQLNRLLLRTDKVIAGMVVIGCLGFAFNHLLVLLERKLIRWQTPV